MGDEHCVVTVYLVVPHFHPALPPPAPIPTELTSELCEPFCPYDRAQARCVTPQFHTLAAQHVGIARCLGPWFWTSRSDVQPGLRAGSQLTIYSPLTILWYWERCSIILWLSFLIFKMELTIRLCKVAVRIKWDNAPKISPMPSTWIVHKYWRKML